jgi:hypothetical protein
MSSMGCLLNGKVLLELSTITQCGFVEVTVGLMANIPLLVMLGSLLVLVTPLMDMIHGFKPLLMLDVIWLTVTKTFMVPLVSLVIVMVKDV